MVAVVVVAVAVDFCVAHIFGPTVGRSQAFYSLPRLLNPQATKATESGFRVWALSKGSNIVPFGVCLIFGLRVIYYPASNGNYIRASGEA